MKIHTRLFAQNPGLRTNRQAGCETLFQKMCRYAQDVSTVLQSILSWSAFEMPRATIVVAIDDPAELDAVASWFYRWSEQILHRSDNHGCGCCVDIWEIEASAEAIAELPQKSYAGEEWTNGG
jgi:hypothetical protein